MNVVQAMGRLLRRGAMRAMPSGPGEPAVRRESPGVPQTAAVPASSARRRLCPQEVVLDVDAGDARRVVQAAAEFLGHVHGLPSAPIARALWRREQVGSTALGQGVAIPHARIAGISGPLTLFMRTRHAVAFGAPDGKPVVNFLVIMVPENGDTDEHLQLLAAVAQAFSDRGFRASLAASTTALQVEGAFAEWATCAAL